jgi:hypothetical protein
VQVKKWNHSNIGNFIEYEMTVQSLEGSRPIWVTNKRYTDFVKLHENLLPSFRQELVRKANLNMGQTGVLPALPAKISGQTDLELTSRQQQLENYMSQVI